MYTIYADGQCIHSNVFALDNMKTINPKLTLSDCAAGSLTMTLPVMNVGYNTIERMTTDISVEKDGVEIWSGRVLSETKDFYNNRVLYCEGALAFFNDSTQPPRKYPGRTIRGFLEDLISVHNAKVAANRRFTIGAVTVHDDSTPDYFTNYEKTMEVINSIIETYGGHMRVRKVNGVLYLDYLAECPNTCTQTIQLGVNLIDFTKSWDMSEFATVIVPLGARLETSAIEELDAYLTVEEVNDGSIYVESEQAIETYGWIEKTVQWDNVTDPEVLLDKAETYLSDIQFDNMQLEINALDMHYLDVDVEAVKLLDEIRVISRPHGLDRLFPVKELEIPLDSPEKTTFKLGDTVKVSLTEVNNQTNSSILERIDSLPKAHSILNEARENANAIMNLATNGFITITKNQTGSEALIISNLQDYTNATKYWKWNINGLTYYDTEDIDETTHQVVPRLAMTMDGSIVADRITSGVLNADIIRTGVLKSLNNNVIFDLDAGKLTMKSGSIMLGAYSSTSQHYMFEVDENGNVYAGSGTFAGTLAGANGTFKGALDAATGNFKGTVQASDFLDANGQSMMDQGKFKPDFLQLKGLTITNASNETSFEVDGGGYVTINGKVTMGANSSINWSNVTNTNLSSNPAYSKAVSADSKADTAIVDAASADSKADTAITKADNANTKYAKLIAGTAYGGTFINGKQIYSPELYFGDSGTYGMITKGTGSDGVSNTNLIELTSNYGIVLNAATNMRFEMNDGSGGLWINIDYSHVHVKYGGVYTDLGTLIDTLTS